MSAPHDIGPNGSYSTTPSTTTAPLYPSPEASYEEITQNPHFFLEKLHFFHQVFGTKFKIPIIGGNALDLHQLFIEVTSRGGIEKTVSDRKWKELMAIFKFGPTITNASFVLRKAYLTLLYHFEQVYYFRKKTPTLVAAARRMVEVGGHVTGTIDNRFNQGYLVTVDMGSEKLSGFLYHLPTDSSAPSRGTHNMYELALREPSPEADMSGYDVFFTEHYVRLKPLYHGQENVIRKRIQILWSTLTAEEKQMYEETGLKGNER